MCDLWKNTTDDPVPVGAIPQQIDYALERLPPAAHLKLYNAGSFFDPLAISPQDYPAIIERVRPFDSLIVENHPNLLGSRVDAFHSSLQQAAPEIRFEVALGLETCHPESLQRLNKRMTLADFEPLPLSSRPRNRHSSLCLAASAGLERTRRFSLGAAVGGVCIRSRCRCGFDHSDASGKRHAGSFATTRQRR